MDRTEAAMILAGVTPEAQRQASAPTNLHVITGTIVGNSADGKARLQIDGIVLSEDDDQAIEIDTLGGLEDGDVATVLLTGEAGHGMTPLAVGAAGSIDRIYADAIKVRELTAEILHATTAYIQDLTAENVTVQDLSAATAYIGNLVANEITVQMLRAASAYVNELVAGNVTAQNLTADHATVTALDTNYARIDAANINQAVIRDAWVDNLMVQSGLISHAGTVYTLDAIQVNASSIKSGTIDVERLIVTGQDGEKYLVHVDVGGEPTYEKLDGNVIEDLTITADKIVAGAVTAEKITTENIVGSGGWINLRNGTFSYTNAQTGDGISWDGQHLYIGAGASIAGVDVSEVVSSVNQVVYDHTYTYDPTTKVYSFTATATKAGTDVTNEYPDDFFIWYLKTEADTTFLGSGKTLTLPASSAIYTGTILGALEDYLDGQLVDSNGDFIQTSDGDDIYARLTWEV